MILTLSNSVQSHNHVGDPMVAPVSETPGWYPIPGYSGYLANKKGEILNKKTQNKTKGGNAGRYLKVSVYRDGDDVATLQYVHDLICRAFHGLPKEGQVVKHKNDKRWDNVPTNIEWGTQSSNIKETYSRGIRKPTYGPRVSKEAFDDCEQDTIIKNTLLTKDTKDLLYTEVQRRVLPLSALAHINVTPPEEAVENADLDEPLFVYSDNVNDPTHIRLIDGAGRLVQHRRLGSDIVPVHVITKDTFIRFDFHTPVTVSNEANKTWDPRFAPAYTPDEMLEMGVFEGKYINNIKGLPTSWYQIPNVLGVKDDPEPSINYFKVKARQPLSVWKKNGWIKTDKNGWFEWYCNYYLGRRLGAEDEWQIGRWRSAVARHQGAITKSGQLKQMDKRLKQRQTLLQWAWDSKVPFDEKALQTNIERLKRKHNISLETHRTWTNW